MYIQHSSYVASCLLYSRKPRHLELSDESRVSSPRNPYQHSLSYRLAGFYARYPTLRLKEFAYITIESPHLGRERLKMSMESPVFIRLVVAQGPSFSSLHSPSQGRPPTALDPLI